MFDELKKKKKSHLNRLANNIHQIIF